MRRFSDSMPPSRLGGFPVDVAFRHRGQLLVGRLFFLKVLLQERCAVVAAKLLCPGEAVAGDLIVFNRLSSGDERRIKHCLVLDLASDFICFLEDAVDCGALDAFGLAAGTGGENCAKRSLYAARRPVRAW